MRKVKWGVLGVAKIATEKVIPGDAARRALRHRRHRLARSGAGARGGGDASASPRAYGSYEALLADPEIEAIYNPLPNELHVPWTIKALEAGKHVLCEKPVALDADEARDADRRARQGRASSSPKPSWCASTRNGGARASSRKPARSARVGAIQTFFSYRLLDPDNVRNRPPGGGGLYDIGCYAILTARYVFGAEPTRVVAHARPRPEFRHRPAGERHPRVSRRPASDLHAPARSCRAHQRVTIVGDAGPDRGPHSRSTRCPTGRCGSSSTTAPTSSAAARGSRTSRSATSTACRATPSPAPSLGEAPLEFPIEDAILNMRVIDALFRSAERGSWETP